MRVLVCGDRNWNDSKMISKALLSLPGHVTIIEGGARGADRMAATIARQTNRMEVEEYLANWDRYGKVAGVIRNLEMLIKGKPDMVIAFHTNLALSKGTAHMISIASRSGIPIKIYP